MSDRPDPRARLAALAAHCDRLEKAQRPKPAAHVRPPVEGDIKAQALADLDALERAGKFTEAAVHAHGLADAQAALDHAIATAVRELRAALAGLVDGDGFDARLASERERVSLVRVDHATPPGPSRDSTESGGAGQRADSVTCHGAGTTPAGSSHGMVTPATDAPDRQPATAYPIGPTLEPPVTPTEAATPGSGHLSQEPEHAADVDDGGEGRGARRGHHAHERRAGAAGAPRRAGRVGPDARPELAAPEARAAAGGHEPQGEARHEGDGAPSQLDLFGAITPAPALATVAPSSGAGEGTLSAGSSAGDALPDSEKAAAPTGVVVGQCVDRRRSPNNQRAKPGEPAGGTLIPDQLLDLPAPAAKRATRGGEGGGPPIASAGSGAYSARGWSSRPGLNHNWGAVPVRRAFDPRRGADFRTVGAAGRNVERRNRRAAFARGPPGDTS